VKSSTTFGWLSLQNAAKRCYAAVPPTPCSRECNHDYAGESFNAPSLPAEVKGGGFMVTTNRKKVGAGSWLSLAEPGCRPKSLQPVQPAACGCSSSYGLACHLGQKEASAAANECSSFTSCTVKFSCSLQLAIAAPFQQIGEGKKVFDAAVKAVKSWQHLQLGELNWRGRELAKCQAREVVRLTAVWRSTCIPGFPSRLACAALPPNQSCPACPSAVIEQLSDNRHPVRPWPPILPPGWNCTTAPAMQNGATICSATQTVVPWSVLPAQVGRRWCIS